MWEHNLGFGRAFAGALGSCVRRLSSLCLYSSIFGMPPVPWRSWSIHGEKSHLGPTKLESRLGHSGFLLFSRPGLPELGRCVSMMLSADLITALADSPDVSFGTVNKMLTLGRAGICTSNDRRSRPRRRESTRAHFPCFVSGCQRLSPPPFSRTRGQHLLRPPPAERMG